MGSKSALSEYVSIENGIQDRSEAEEYDFEDVLETYSLPLDGPIAKGLTSASNSSSTSNGGANMSGSFGEFSRSKKSRKIVGSRGGSRILDPLSSHPAADAVSAAVVAAAARTVISGNSRHDSSGCSCYRIHSSENCEQLAHSKEPKCAAFFRPPMGDLEPTTTIGNRKATGGGGRRWVMHQPLKTVSIIDTLSELAATEPEVRRLAQEPRQELRQTRDGEEARSTGPPVVSADFQEYTEKVYGAVTSSSRNKLTIVARTAVSRLKREEASKFGDPSFQDFSTKAENCGHHLRSYERGRTPDWIKRIFDIAKKGKLAALKNALSDMEDALIRNLSDHNGNNLLHVMAVFGHLAPTAWLLTSQNALVDAVHDENKYGLTPLVCSIKYGRVRLLQWLVQNTGVKDRIKCKDGERSLLHIAAKYAQEEILSWLVDYMMSHEISLDGRDHHGNTALHLAARTGNSRVCSILLQNGADVTLKNDLGQKAWEVCVVRGHLACAEYLCVHESGLSLATDLTRREAELETANTDNHELKINFKEVSSIARRLLREREDAVRELSRLHDLMINAHDNVILTLQVLAEEAAFREKASEVRSLQDIRENVETAIGYVNELHERWQSAQKTWFGSSLVDMKHRMLLVEEAWKKLKHKNHRTVATTHHPLDVFRGKLCAVRAQGGEGKLGDLPALCSSEESIASLFPFSDDEDDGTSNEYEVLSPGVASTPAKVVPTSEKRGNAHPSQNLIIRSNGTSPAFNEQLSTKKNMDPESLSHRKPNKGKSSKLLSKSHSVRSPNPYDHPTHSYWADSSISTSLSILNDINSGEKLQRKEINAKLKELALTSESGSCSVLEVIEPSSDESDNEKKRPSEITSALGGDSSSGENCSHSLQDRRSRRMNRQRHENNDSSKRELLTSSSESGGDSIKNKNEKHFLGNEASIEAAAVGVSEFLQRPPGDSELCESTSGFAFKRKGFLHKFSLKPRWPSKRKLKSPRKIEIGTKEFQETYGSCGRAVETNSLIGDAETLITTPESNTSSSQEYSSEESPTGKPISASNRISELSPSENDSKLDSERRPDFVKTAKLSTFHDKSSPTASVLSLKRVLPILPVPEEGSLPPPSPSYVTASESHSKSRVKSTVSEMRSISTSEDSGIVVRPASSASKSDSVSRPDSSSSAFPPFKNDYNFQKSNLSLTQDLLPVADHAGRMSPAPSEASKTESALSPPSHASSDVSKSESARQLGLGKSSLGGSTNSNSSKDGSASSDYSLTLLPLKKDLAVKTAAIVDISCEQKNKLSSSPEVIKTVNTRNGRSNQEEKPWYECSDEESDILLPDKLTERVVAARHSSSEDEIC